MRAETQNTVETIRKSLDLLRQRMDYDTAQHRMEEFNCLLYTSPSPRDQRGSRMPSSA